MLGLIKKRSKYYPDVGLFLVLIPVISAINYYLTYNNIRFNWYLIYRYLIDTGQGFLAWILVRQLILYLDIRLPYEKGFWRRVLIQGLTTTVLGLGVIAATTEILSEIIFKKPAPLDFYSVDMVIIGIWFFFINAIYVGLYYYNKFMRVEAQIKEVEGLKSAGYRVKEGKRDFIIGFDCLMGFYVDSEHSVAVDNNNKIYYIKDSLETIRKQIPKDIFFRLNRKFILNKAYIKGYERIENGKLFVLLKNNRSFPPKITVSRDKASQFKKWFN
ncbi:MAG: LytTR family DNA-binding domain-containing protein [Bacteroidota bacterium]